MVLVFVWLYYRDGTIALSLRIVFPGGASGRFITAWIGNERTTRDPKKAATFESLDFAPFDVVHHKRLSQVRPRFPNSSKAPICETAESCSRSTHLGEKRVPGKTVVLASDASWLVSTALARLTRDWHRVKLTHAGN